MRSTIITAFSSVCIQYSGFCQYFDCFLENSRTGAAEKAELQRKVTQLQTLALKSKIPGQSQKLAFITQNLSANSGIADEIRKIFDQLLADIEARMKILGEVDKHAHEMVETTEAKAVEWQKKLVGVANAADKTQAQMATAALEREKLNGHKKIAHANYDHEKEAFTEMIPPFEREIYVITMIKIKINEHCEAADAGGGAAI